MPLCVSTLVGDYLEVDRIFRLYIMTVSDIYSCADLFILDMLDFDMILGMDWLSHYYAVMDYFAKTITLAMPGIHPVVWQGAITHESMGIIFLCLC